MVEAVVVETEEGLVFHYSGTPNLPTHWELTGCQLGIHVGSLAAACTIAGLSPPTLQDPRQEAAEFTREAYPGIHPVRLSGDFLEVRDMGIWDAQEVVEEIRHKLKCGDAFEVHAADDPEQCLRDILTRRGYNGLRYINETEDVGSTSFLITNPNNLNENNL